MQTRVHGWQIIITALQVAFVWLVAMPCGYAGPNLLTSLDMSIERCSDKKDTCRQALSDLLCSQTVLEGLLQMLHSVASKHACKHLRIGTVGSNEHYSINTAALDGLPGAYMVHEYHSSPCTLLQANYAS